MIKVKVISAFASTIEEDINKFLSTLPTDAEPQLAPPTSYLDRLVVIIMYNA